MGTINTKFNVEDDIYCVNKNRIVKGRIKKILIETTFDYISTYYSIKFDNSPAIRRHEDDIHSSIDDLVAAIQ